MNLIEQLEGLKKKKTPYQPLITINNTCMTLEQTILFVKKWNEANGFEDGINMSENMRADEQGVIYWNSYDSPLVDIEQFVNIYNQTLPTP
jgi:hypothetical protein